MGGPELLDEKKKQQLYTDTYDDAMWLISLVENLLTVTRIENGRCVLETGPELAAALSRNLTAMLPSFVFLMYSITAVSYTHLDVYKRQALRRINWLCACT